MRSRLAQHWLAAAVPEARRGVGLTAHGFKLLAQVVGMRPRVLRRHIVRQHTRSWTLDRRKRGRHDYLDGVLKARALREAFEKNPWLGALIGSGALVGSIAYALGVFGRQKAA